MFADPHTPVVLAGPLLQSALVQQPAVAMHRLVPGQFLNPPTQPIVHLPVASQIADPLAAGAGHATHAVPQKLVLVSAWQMPLQLCMPPEHIPLQAFAAGMQTPAHSFMPFGQAGMHASPSQVTLPPVGT